MYAMTPSKISTCGPLKVKTKNTFVEFMSDAQDQHEWAIDGGVQIKRQESAPAKVFHRQVSCTVPVYESIREGDESDDSEESRKNSKESPKLRGTYYHSSHTSGSEEPETEPGDRTQGSRPGDGLQSAVLETLARQISEGWHVTNPNRQSSELSIGSWGRQETLEHWPMWEHTEQRMERATSLRPTAQPVQTVQTVKEEQEEQDEQDGINHTMPLPWQQAGMPHPLVYSPLSMPWPFLGAAAAYHGGRLPEHWLPGFDDAHTELPKKQAMRPMSKRKAKSLITLAAEAKMQQQHEDLQQHPQQTGHWQQLQQQQKQLAEAAIKAETDLSMNESMSKMHSEMLQQRQQQLAEAAIKAENGLLAMDAADKDTVKQSQQRQVAKFCPYCSAAIEPGYKFCACCRASVAHVLS
jgi:hypothetical protein